MIRCSPLAVFSQLKAETNGRREPVKKSRTGATVSLAAMLVLGVPTMSAAATFVYVSDAEDATIDAYVMDRRPVP